MGEQSRLTVVIPVHNGARTIGTQLDALSKLETTFPWDIVIADNGSTDHTKAIAESHPIGVTVPLRVVDATHTRGANVARNRGVEETRSPLIVFCDCDDAVRPRWLPEHYEALSTSPDVISAGPLMIDVINTPSTQRLARGLSQPERAGDFSFGWGANFGMSRSLWESCGGFSTDFSNGFDEIEFMIRAQKNGAAFVWVEGAVVDYRLPVTQRAAFRRAVSHGSMRAQIAQVHGDVFPAYSLTTALRRCSRYFSRWVRAVIRRRDRPRLETLGYSVGLVLGQVSRPKR